MKVLLLQDVYNLGRAGEIKKVANGYGRNYLIPQRFAVLATPGALTQVERIQADANKRRNILNEEMAEVAEKLINVQLAFAARAGETGKLYGSVTTQMIADELSEKLGAQISKRQIDSQPLRLLGMHTVKVRLTIDLIPEISVVVYREGEAIENYMVSAEKLGSIAQDETPFEVPADQRLTEAVEDVVEEVIEEASSMDIPVEEIIEEEAEAVETEEAEAEENTED